MAAQYLELQEKLIVHHYARFSEVPGSYRKTKNCRASAKEQLCHALISDQNLRKGIFEICRSSSLGSLLLDFIPD